MKVRVLPDVCVGHGMCILACPQLFQLNDDDAHAFTLAEDVPPELEDDVLCAVRGCPEGAIKTY